MNNNKPVNQLSMLSICALAAALLMPVAASAQTPTGSPQSGQAPHPAPAQDTSAVEKEEEAFDLPQQVGDATLNLFARQRSGEIASPTARPIAGGVAGRSYERYLKSFEHPIPERLGSSVTNAKNGGGASNAGSR
jgi:outer membrane receptor protein involved in Fe transport